MIFIQMCIIIIISFLFMYVIVSIHRQYSRTLVFYKEKMKSIDANQGELQLAMNEIVSITQELKARYEISSTLSGPLCHKDSTKECTICDGNCPFRKDMREEYKNRGDE